MSAFDISSTISINILHYTTTVSSNFTHGAKYQKSSHITKKYIFFEGGLGLNIRYFCDAPEYLGVKSDPRFQSCQGGAIYRIGSHMVQYIPKVHTKYLTSSHIVVQNIYQVHTWCNISQKFTQNI